MKQSWEILYYATEAGDSPVEAFIQSLPLRDQRKVFFTIEVLQHLGIQIREPYAKALEGEKNLFELRSQSGNNIQRVFYFHYTGSQLVLLHGFTKKTQKTPKPEIETALKRRQDFLNRMET